ncbi:hypothetical protein SDC9_170716 [bioreactor metagenome]|uniref:Uncharacterized protein n=1 Tax=bioreactor metagenome TaxID=1076179 RepID=A0A645G8V5_9ZZZZ
MRNRRAARDADIHAQLVCNDVCKRRFAKAWRAIEQHMIERVAAFFGRLDKNAHMLLGFLLANVFVQISWPEAVFIYVLFLHVGSN